MNQKVIQIPEIYFKFFENLSKTITENLNLKVKRIYVTPATYPKYPKIPNLNKIFRILWVPDRVSGKIQTQTEIACPKTYPIGNLPCIRNRTRPISFTRFQLIFLDPDKIFILKRELQNNIYIQNLK